MVRMVVRWTDYGQIRWEEWWTSTHGRNLTREATAEEHVGFANFDLGQAGLPSLAKGEDGSLVLPLVPNERVALAEAILKRHGFEVVATDSR